MKTRWPLLVTTVGLALLLAQPAHAGSAREEMRATLRLEMLRLINADRVAHGLRPVELDVEASAIADRYCEQQIRNGTTGHFTTDGLTPYMRYSFASGDHGVSENAASWSANYNFTDRMIPEIIRRSQEAMMREVPPDDGHRRTILDAHATHVGVGFAWKGGEFRLAQEFVRKYIQWSATPSREATVGGQITARGKAVDGYLVESISVYYEPLPSPLSASAASGIDNYSFPRLRYDYLRQPHSPSTRTVSRRSLAEVARISRPAPLRAAADGSFSFAAPITDGAGVYTVVVWVRPAPGGEPIPASNISVRVGNGSQDERGAR